MVTNKFKDNLILPQQWDKFEGETLPGGKVMSLESEGLLLLDLDAAPGREVVDGVAVAELCDPVAGLINKKNLLDTINIIK